MSHHKINYIEFATRDLTASKQFFSSVFGWKFTDYGDNYSSFEEAGISGGFFTAEKTSTTEQGGVLVVIFSEQLEQTQQAVEEAGGKISQAIFSFPGGRRFQFLEPGGNELSVWTHE